MKSKVNIKTIAELAGVSVATVSRVINQNGRFSAETEATVKRVMEELHYVPNTVAKGLRENRTKVIGVIVPDITNPHFAKFVLEIETKLFEYSYSTVICNTNESVELEQKHVDTLISKRVDGIIFISGIGHYYLDDIATVYVDRRPDGYDEQKLCIVESDNENGGYLAAKKLIECGCHDIAILYSYHMDFNQKMRYKGYKKALKEAGLTEQTIDVKVISAPAATEAVKNHIENGNHFDGLVCTTDTLAVGAILALQEIGLRVPEDVKLTGFDDSTLASLYTPSISSIRQMVSLMAEKAVENLMAIIEDEDIETLLHVLPVRLVERETTSITK